MNNLFYKGQLLESKYYIISSHFFAKYFALWMPIPEELEQIRSNSPEGKGPGLDSEPEEAEYRVSLDDHASLCFPHLQMRLESLS